MREVAGRVIAGYLTVARDQHLDVGALLAGLAIEPDDLHARIGWEPSVTLLERMMNALGGPPALEDAFARAEGDAPDLLTLAAHLETPMRLALFVNGTLAASNVTCLRQRPTELGPQRYEHRVETRPGYRSHLGVVAATVGALRGQPRLLGLSEAQVTWSGIPTSFVCRVTLPSNRSSSPRVTTLAPEARSAAGRYLGALLADRTHYRRDAQRVDALLTRLGAASQRDSSSDELAREAVDALRLDLGHTFSSIAVPERGGLRVLATQGTRDGSTLEIPLELAGRIVGVLETDPIDGAETLSALAPLLALGLRQRLDREQPPPSSGTFPDEWRLTKRQREVVELIVLGQSNPLIAATLGCAIGTIEDHLTAIYEKAGVDGRQPLSAKLFAFRRGLERGS